VEEEQRISQPPCNKRLYICPLCNEEVLVPGRSRGSRGGKRHRTTAAL
jgi:hypothetical protein